MPHLSAIRLTCQILSLDYVHQAEKAQRLTRAPQEEKLNYNQPKIDCKFST